MKTITKNMFEELDNWMELHKKADEIIFHEVRGRKYPIKAIYSSPVDKWSNVADSRGDYKVPDMDYYNSSLLRPQEMDEVVDYLKEGITTS